MQAIVVFFFNLDVFIYVNQAFGFVTNYSLFLASVSIIIFISPIFFSSMSRNKELQEEQEMGLHFLLASL